MRTKIPFPFIVERAMCRMRGEEYNPPKFVPKPPKVYKLVKMSLMTSRLKWVRVLRKHLEKEYGKDLKGIELVSRNGTAFVLRNGKQIMSLCGTIIYNLETSENE